MSVMRLRRARMAAVARSMASSAARSSAWGSPLLRAPERTMRRAASSCSVSSCNSRAQRTRSRSEASTLRRSPWAATFWAVMTAVAAVAAKACTRRWSSGVNSGPATVRSKAASTPTASPRKTSGTMSPVEAPTCSASAKRSRDGASARRSGCWLRRTSPATDPSTASLRPTTSAGTSPAAAWTTSSSPSRSATSIARASTRARPRLTSSSRMRSRSVSPPTARAIEEVVSRAATARSSSSRRAATPRYRRAFSIAIAAQSARTTSASSSPSSKSPSAFSVR